MSCQEFVIIALPKSWVLYIWDRITSATGLCYLPPPAVDFWWVWRLKSDQWIYSNYSLSCSVLVGTTWSTLLKQIAQPYCHRLTRWTLENPIFTFFPVFKRVCAMWGLWENRLSTLCKPHSSPPQFIPQRGAISPLLLCSSPHAARPLRSKSCLSLLCLASSLLLMPTLHRCRCSVMFHS